jgi:D-glycero-D-manno-heptose 1,7-bisphosphate phosphatase
MFIILDRDGVINEESDVYIKNPDEWLPIPGSLQAIAALNKAGHSVVIATNQSGIARGLYTEEGLKQIHNKMLQALAKEGGHIDGIFYCPHHPDQNCFCRKPQPGLLLQIAQQYDVDLQKALFIGDSMRDITCAKAVGCKPILVKTGKGLTTLAMQSHWDIKEVPVFANLQTAVAKILQGVNI